MLRIVNESCLSLFSEEQQLQLPTVQQIAQRKTVDSWVYLFDDNQLLPENFKNDFAWRCVYNSMHKNDIDSVSILDLP
ncbi:unnamed protein product, partial [Rotaria sp. Silwood2]